MLNMLNNQTVNPIKPPLNQLITRPQAERSPTGLGRPGLQLHLSAERSRPVFTPPLRGRARLFLDTARRVHWNSTWNSTGWGDQWLAKLEMVSFSLWVVHKPKNPITKLKLDEI
jgi:hypothetical protein